jgi:hypothetical protein
VQSIELIPHFATTDPTIEITLDLVKEAMESISFIDVVAWTKSIFASSMLSHRKKSEFALKALHKTCMNPCPVWEGKMNMLVVRSGVFGCLTTPFTRR